MKLHVHYEAAFEDYLRRRQAPYVAVDEAHRSTFRDARLKSFDFIVYSPQQSNWLVDIKGRRWAARHPRRKPTWQNWVTQADLDGLRQWQEVFGDGFRGLLLFAYWIDAAAPAPAELVHAFKDHRYIFAGVPVDDYLLHARLRSPKWETVNVLAADFARCVRPIEEWL